MMELTAGSPVVVDSARPLVLLADQPCRGFFSARQEAILERLDWLL
jgi:hypothetical protein